MAEIERRDSIGEVLGNHLALFEEDLTLDPDDMEIMEKIRIISEAYRNFAVGGLESFQNDFEQGYRLGKRDMYLNRDMRTGNSVDPKLDFDNS